MSSKGGYDPALPTKYDSIVFFDVKPWEAAINLTEVAQKITRIQMDGLAWNSEWKILPIAFGLNKLQIGCRTVNEKVNIDDVTQKISQLEELVQSVDIVSFAKI